MKTGKFYDIWEHKPNVITYKDSAMQIEYIYSDKHI